MRDVHSGFIEITIGGVTQFVSRTARWDEIDQEAETEAETKGARSRDHIKPPPTTHRKKKSRS